MHRRGAPALLAVLAACSGAPAPSRGTLDARRPADADPPSTGPRTEPPARWVESRGATLVGPHVSSPVAGTLVLMGGRRAILRDDGGLENERVATKDPLLEIVAVPRRGGGDVIVGRGQHTVYRLDDPLGAPVVLVRSEQELVRVGAGPGVVAVWRRNLDEAAFVDVESGDQARAGFSTPLPLRGVAFLDARHGASALAGAGLAVTTDGGASWRAIHEGGLRSSSAVYVIHGDEEKVLARWHRRRIGVADVDAGRLSSRDTTPTGAAPLLRWIEATSLDPLLVAASRGIRAPGGHALIAEHGLVARVDLATGGIDEIVDLADGQGSSGCSLARVAETAWVACVLPERASMTAPFSVSSGSIERLFRAPLRSELVRGEGAALQSSPSGGLALLAPCEVKAGALGACVRQPKGGWATVETDVELGPGSGRVRAAGPLVDGGIAYVTGITEPSPLRVVLRRPRGEPRVLAVAEDAPEITRLPSPVEELPSGDLRFIAASDDDVFVALAHPRRGDIELRKVGPLPNADGEPEGVFDARLHHGDGLALGARHLFATNDGGASWTLLPDPPATDQPVRRRIDEVGEVGAFIDGGSLLVGWNVEAMALPPEAERERPPTKALTWATELDVRLPDVVCRSGAPVVPAPAAFVAELEDRDPPPRSNGSSHRPRRAQRTAVEDPAIWVSLEEEGFENVKPDTWTLTWIDRRELGGRMRAVTFPAPENAGWGATIVFAEARGSHAFARVRSDRGWSVVRTRSRGGVDVADSSSDPRKSSLGEGTNDAVAWLGRGDLDLWPPNEEPREIASLSFAKSSEVALGTPSAAGVPVLVLSSEQAAVRIVPDVRSVPSSSRQADPDLRGWRVVPLAASRSCAPSSTAPRFSYSDVDAVYRPRLVLDGASEKAIVGADLRVDAEGVCVAGLVLRLEPRPDAQVLVRMDVARRRAEIGDRGLPGFMRPASCAFAPEAEAPRRAGR